MDDKKIEDAAKQHSEESYISDYFQACYKDAFMECAKWVQEEFLKDLWHPVSEEPKKGRVFLYKTIFKGYGLNKIIDGNEWKYIIKYKKATQEMKQFQEDYIKALPVKIGDKIMDEDGRVGQLSRIVPYRSPSERFMCATLSLTLFFHMEKKDGTYDNREVYVHGFPIKL